MIPPLRKVLFVLTPAPDRRHADTVMLECRHEAKATGKWARCVQCMHGMQEMFPVRRRK